MNNKDCDNKTNVDSCDNKTNVDSCDNETTKILKEKIDKFNNMYGEIKYVFNKKLISPRYKIKYYLK